MLQDIDNMEASCILYVKVGRFNQFEQTKISLLTVTSMGIVMLTVHHDLMVSMWLIQDPGDVLRQTSPDIHSIKQCHFYIYHSWDFTCCSAQCFPVIKQTTSDWHTANRGTLGIPCSYTQQDLTWIDCASWLSLIRFWLLANFIIFRTSLFFSLSSFPPFHNRKPWLQKHVNQVQLDPNRAKRQTLHPMCHLVRHSSKADSS